jgi:hypothetical protein
MQEMGYSYAPSIIIAFNQLVAYQCTLVLHFHRPQGYEKAPSFVSLAKTRMGLKIN